MIGFKFERPLYSLRLREPFLLLCTLLFLLDSTSALFSGPRDRLPTALSVHCPSSSSSAFLLAGSSAFSRDDGKQLSRPPRRPHTRSRALSLSTRRETGGLLRSRSRSCLRMGLNECSREQPENVVIVGSGPAGYTAAIFAARANLKPVVFEGISSGPPGGQLMTTTMVENFPGFPEGVMGPELVRNMRRQALRWGAEMIEEDVIEVNIRGRPFTVKTPERDVDTHAIIFATGATANRLMLPNEYEFWNRGISSSAVCDGTAPMFRDQVLGIVGGGDTAIEEAIFLSEYASKVEMFVRSGQLRASKAMQDKLACTRNIEVHYQTTVKDVYGDKVGSDHASPVRGVLVQNVETLEDRKVPLRGLFYACGHKPNTLLLQGSPVKLVKGGYVMVTPGTAETSMPGIFSAGDVMDARFRQAVTAAGSGCVAAMTCERWLISEGLAREWHSECDVAGQGREVEVDDLDDHLLNESKETFDLSSTRHHGTYAFTRLRKESQKPVLVKFISPNCGPCQILQPIISNVVDDFNDSIHYVEVDITESPDIASDLDVSGTPTVKLMREGIVLDSVQGVRGPSVYRDLIETALRGFTPLKR
uniref:Thioredoxin domain-containing protein n=1 Tax=Chromera velia CCMP2878 TaxID=1169474 RepID=A0A0G4HFU5_9ALVE|eukprot:Cvel_27161.t1-p1 / transcript=Cvel_27161.t1 / gene=Cvel_27161 / organism=Chromera_velia_CCMP2878 / gene_product=NADPH-dependent thioredoxin reductase 3, putative / transcript_product=NADPH-dependent thioredoxin reductase 3, putative / location=Cvel_scaffold3344:7664-16002(-) / protein_length=589 / sequence_SO=supercontig / SO=protein_coding / is_pseudo=false